MDNNRFQILLSTFFLIFLIIIGRLFYWQIIKGQELRNDSLSRQSKLEKIYPQEGHLLASDHFPLSLDHRYYLLSLYKPNLKQDIDTTFNQISQVYSDFLSDNQRQIELFRQPQIKWVTFSSHFNHSQKDQLKQSGFSFEEKNIRIYPENMLAFNIIKNLESFYRRTIAGKTGFSYLSIDGTGQPILGKKNWHKKEVDGQSISLSLNRQIQSILETSLQQGIDRYQAESGSGIIIKPQTGEIIAISTLPISTESATQVKNISHLFEPGSIFKPLVVAIGLDSRQIKSDFICHQCHQARTFGQYTINNWDKQFHPDSNLVQIITNSDNIGMSYIIEAIGLKTFQEYFAHLQLNQKSGVDLVGESLSPPKKYFSQIDLATASFGQGFALNQLQMIKAFNTLANKGILVTPHLNRELSTPNVTVFSTDTTNQIIEILQTATKNSAIASQIPPGLDVCAKSGTAQIAIDGQYTEEDTIGSYIGFSPCFAPKFTMLITLEKPKLSTWGSSTAAPIWFEIAEKIEPLL